MKDHPDSLYLKLLSVAFSPEPRAGNLNLDTQIKLLWARMMFDNFRVDESGLRPADGHRLSPATLQPELPGGFPTFLHLLGQSL